MLVYTCSDQRSNDNVLVQLYSLHTHLIIADTLLHTIINRTIFTVFITDVSIT